MGGLRPLGITSVARVSTIEQICGGIDLGQSAPVCTELTLVAQTFGYMITVVTAMALFLDICTLDSSLLWF